MRERRRFLVSASSAVVALATAALIDAPNVVAQPKVQWRMPTTWTPALDHLQGAAQRLAQVTFNKKAYEALPVDLRRTLDHAAATVQVYGLAYFHARNAIALGRLRTEFKAKVEVLPLPTPVLRDLRKLSAEVVREQSEKTPMARTVHVSYTKFQALVSPWDHVAEGSYHQLVAG